jgi:hypothetical protein
MNPYDIMHEWDHAAGIAPRSDEDLDRDIPARLSTGDYKGWKTGLEEGNIQAIKEGMMIWGLPMEPLRPFEIDEAIETAERPYSLN